MNFGNFLRKTDVLASIAIFIVIPEHYFNELFTIDFQDWTKKITTTDSNIPDGFEGMDIGPKTQKLFADELSKAKMIFWNGPMGVFEQKDFEAGTRAVCEAVSKLKGAFTVIGGGDSAAAVAQFGYKDYFSHVSTGGGASLEMIENDGHLPGIDVIG